MNYYELTVRYVTHVNSPGHTELFHSILFYGVDQAIDHVVIVAAIRHWRRR